MPGWSGLPAEHMAPASPRNMDSELVPKTPSYTCSSPLMTSRRRRRNAATEGRWAFRMHREWTKSGGITRILVEHMAPASPRNMDSELVPKTSSYTCSSPLMTSRRRRRNAATEGRWAFRMHREWTKSGGITRILAEHMAPASPRNMDSELVPKTPSYTCSSPLMMRRRRRRNAATEGRRAFRMGHAWATMSGAMTMTEPVRRTSGAGERARRL